MLDGQFDFNVYDVANTTFAGVGGSNLQQLKAILNASLCSYGSHNLMGNISGNHDKPRFMAYASGDLKFGEDSKAAGWQRNLGITDSTAYDKLLLMNAFNMTIPGIPVIYYGDEIGLTGANDPDCRKMMRFKGLNNREKKLLASITKLAHLRSDNPVFMYGDFINIQATTTTWIYARKYFNKEAILIFNNSSSAKTIEITLPKSIKSITFASVFNTKFSKIEAKLTVALAPFSMDVLIN
jgi:glycosidase